MAEDCGGHCERVIAGKSASDDLTDEEDQFARDELAVNAAADVSLRLSDDGSVGAESRTDKPYGACLSSTRVVGWPRAAARSR